MDQPINPSAEYKKQLIALGVDEHILKQADLKDREWNAVYINLVELIKPGQNAADKIAYPWQLEALAGKMSWLPDPTQSAMIANWMDNKGLTIAHYLAMSGNIMALSELLEKYPILIDSIDKNRRTIAHYATMSGSTQMLTHIIDTYPQLIKIKDVRGKTIAHIAAELKHQHIIDFLLQQPTPHICQLWTKNLAGKMPEGLDLDGLLLTANQQVMDGTQTQRDIELLVAFQPDKIVFFAATGGNLAVLTWIASNAPDRLTSKDPDGKTLVYHAIQSGQASIFRYLLKEHPMLIKQLWIPDNTGDLPDAPEEMQPKPAKMMKTAIQAARTRAKHGLGSQNDFDLLMAFDFDRIDSLGQTLVHYAAKTGDCAIIKRFLAEAPDLMKRLWIPDKEGQLPQALEQQGQNEDIQTILAKRLNKATKRMGEGRLTSNDIAILIAFKAEWKANLTTFDITNIFTSLHDVDLTDQRLTPSTLLNIVLLAQQDASLFFQASTKNALFIIQLETFIKKIVGVEELDTDHEQCLRVILNDYNHVLLGSKSNITELLANKLASSLTLSKPKPKSDDLPAKDEDTIDIIPENYALCLERFIAHVKDAQLDDYYQREIENVIIPGIRRFTDPDVIDDILKKMNVLDRRRDTLYYLNDNLPIHLYNYNQPATRAEKKDALNNAIIDFFDSTELAYKQGKFAEFCMKISSGFCFEGRTASAYDWLRTSYKELMPFVELINEYITTEYEPYVAVMSDPAVKSNVIERATDFILTRHAGTKCQAHQDYAPRAVITRAGIEQYLETVFKYTHQALPADRTDIFTQIDALVDALQRESTYAINYPYKQIKQTKIAVLLELKREISENNIQPFDAAVKLKRLFPEASSMFFRSRTKRLLDALEDDHKLTPK